MKLVESTLKEIVAERPEVTDDSPLIVHRICAWTKAMITQRFMNWWQHGNTSGISDLLVKRPVPRNEFQAIGLGVG
jgi:hypothetical protein